VAVAAQVGTELLGLVEVAVVVAEVQDLQVQVLVEEQELAD
jgi:hypothetical protein